MVMDDCLNIALICAHTMIREVLSTAFRCRGHNVRETNPLVDCDLAAIHSRCISCAVLVVCTWGLERSGNHLIRRLATVDPQRRIVAIDCIMDPHAAEALLRSGATAVLGPHIGLSESLEVIEAAARGDSFADESPSTPKSAPGISRDDVLSRRETEVLQLVVDGHDVRSISQQLYISPKTVKHHLSAIYAKLGAVNRTDAVVQGLRNGFVELRSC